MAREATTSVATDSDGGIDENVNIVMTIAESSGYGTVDAVVHRPPRRAKTSHDGSRAALHGAGKVCVCVSHSRLVHCTEPWSALLHREKRSRRDSSPTPRPRDSRKRHSTHADTL